MPNGEVQTGVDILGFKVRHLFEYLIKRETVSQEIEDISYPNTCSADAGPSPTLFQVNRDTLRYLGHNILFLLMPYRNALNPLIYSPLADLRCSSHRLSER